MLKKLICLSMIVLAGTSKIYGDALVEGKRLCFEGNYSAGIAEYISALDPGNPQRNRELAKYIKKYAKELKTSFYTAKSSVTAGNALEEVYFRELYNKYLTRARALADSGDYAAVKVLTSIAIEVFSGGDEAQLLENKALIALAEEEREDTEPESLMFKQVKPCYLSGIKALVNNEYSRAKDEFIKVIKFVPHERSKRYLQFIEEQVLIETQRLRASEEFKALTLSTGNINLEETVQRLAHIIQADERNYAAYVMYKTKVEELRTQREIRKCIVEFNNSIESYKYSDAFRSYLQALNRGYSNETKKDMSKLLLKKVVAELTAKTNDLSVLRSCADDELQKSEYQNAINYLMQAFMIAPEDKVTAVKLIGALSAQEVFVDKNKAVMEQNRKIAEIKERREKWIREKVSDAENFYEQKVYAKAEQIILQVLEISPGDKKALEVSEKIRVIRKNIAQNVSTVTECKTVNQEDVESYYKLGLKLYMQGQYEEAIIAWRKVLEIDPGNDPAKKNICEAEQKRGKK
ncbi:MAG: tetratricopeptide repeat protein [Elusimicrobiota bacterium]